MKGKLLEEAQRTNECQKASHIVLDVNYRAQRRKQKHCGERRIGLSQVLLNLGSAVQRSVKKREGGKKKPSRRKRT